MALQSKCPSCRVRYAWQRSYKLREAYCPTCGSKLQRTSDQSTLPLDTRTPVSYVAAVRLGKPASTAPQREGR